MMNIRQWTVLVLVAVVAAHAESALQDEITSYLDVLTCAARDKPWDCVYSRSGRILDSLSAVVQRKDAELKAEADREFQMRLEARGFSDTNITEKDKPSKVISSLETAVSGTVKSVIERAKGGDKKKRRKKPSQSVQVVEYEKPDIYELIDDDDDHGGFGGQGGGGNKKRKGGIRRRKKHGRSVGGKGGKGKKKKKRAMMKLLLIGAVLKAKIELLLKIVSTHLQIKFFVVAVIGLLINIARFWVDLKKGHAPQKVVYYEHAHHQHVYDDHDEGGWGLGSSHSGNYWKRRSLNEKGEPIEVTYSASPDSIPSSGPPPGAAVASASYETYRPYESAPNIYGSVVPSASGYTDPQSIVYSKSRPDSYSGFL